MSRVHEALTRVRAADGGRDVASAPHEGVPLFPADGLDFPDATSPSEEASVVEGDTAKSVHPAEVMAQQDVIADEPRGPELDNRILEEPSFNLGEKIVLSPDTDHASVEQYRRLAGRLHLAQAEHGMKVIMVASALPGEGKTLTATNLALTLSESYHRDVLLIDGDLRRPSIHEMFRIPNVSGLNDGVRSETDRKVPLMRWSDHLTIITAGRPDPDPMKVLISQRMRKVIAEAATRFQWVIIDTPPVGLLTDASLFSAMVDTAVLVVQAGRTPHGEIQRAVQSIGRDRIFGVVLNRAKSNRLGGYGGYRYQYGSALASK